MHSEVDGFVLVQYPNSRLQFCGKIHCNPPSRACHKFVGGMNTCSDSPSQASYRFEGGIKIPSNSPSYGSYKFVGGTKIRSNPPACAKCLDGTPATEFIQFDLRRNRIALGMVHAANFST